MADIAHEARTGVAAGPAGRTVAARAFAVWSVAFGLGVLYHEWQAGPEILSIHTVVGITAIMLLVRPSSLTRLTVVLIALIVELAIDLPAPLNHEYLVGVAGAGVLIDLLWSRTRRDPPSGPAFFVTYVAPMLRVAFIVMWGAAALAKLNSDFLSPATSCAVYMIDLIPFVDANAIPAVGHTAIVVATVATELSIPILLLFRRTRVAGVALGWMFHLLASFAGHTAFSGFGWSMYLLFLTTGTLAAMADVSAEQWRRLSRDVRVRVQRLWRHPATPAVLAGVWLCGVALLQLLPEVWFNRARRLLPMAPYAVAALGWGWLAWQALRRTDPPDDAEPATSLRLRSPAAVVVIALVVASAISPYVGLKTRYSFTMYSNLRTEADRWNHLLVPSSVRVAGLQDELLLVRRVDGVAGDTEAAAIVGQLVPVGEARRILARHPDATVTYEQAGATRIADPVASDPTIGTALPAGTAKLLGFRSVAPVGICQH